MPTANRSAKSPVARRCKHADGSGEDKRIRLANVGHLAAFDDISHDRRALPSNGIVVIPSPFHLFYLGFRRGAALSLAVKMGLTSMSSLRSPQPWASLLCARPSVVHARICVRTRTCRLLFIGSSLIGLGAAARGPRQDQLQSAGVNWAWASPMLTPESRLLRI
jgi:hypothetical protein